MKLDEIRQFFHVQIRVAFLVPVIPNHRMCFDKPSNVSVRVANKQLTVTLPIQNIRYDRGITRVFRGLEKMILNDDIVIILYLMQAMSREYSAHN